MKEEPAVTDGPVCGWDCPHRADHIPWHKVYCRLFDSHAFCWTIRGPLRCQKCLEYFGQK